MAKGLVVAVRGGQLVPVSSLTARCSAAGMPSSDDLMARMAGHALMSLSNESSASAVHAVSSSDASANGGRSDFFLQEMLHSWIS